MCENHLDSSKNDANQQTCNKCRNATCNVVKASNGARYNWYCEKGKTIRMLELSCPANTQIQTPDWCPLSKETSKTSEDPSWAKFKQKTDILDTMPPMTKWEDIKVNEIYRLPPILGWERADIWIKTKGPYSCTYVELKQGINPASAPTKYLYPSSKQAKFIVPHKNMKMEIKTAR